MEARHQVILERIPCRSNLSLPASAMLCLLFSSVNAVESPSCTGIGDIVEDTIIEDFSDLDGNINCTANLRITLGDQSQLVTLFDGATVTLTAKNVAIQPNVAVESGAILAIVNRILLNDTGITWGGSYPSGNNATCTSNGTIAAPQDCDQGRDAAYNDNSDGHAGFNYTKLDSIGSPLPADAANWSCVKDNVTGLIWEVKTDDGGIHDKDNTYRWGGKTAQGSGYGYYYDDWDTLVDGANAESLCGFSDWRVPTRKELENIVSRDVYNPSIDTDYFPNTNSLSFWSSSPTAVSSNYAWFVYFGNGESFYYAGRASNLNVRLVRSRQ